MPTNFASNLIAAFALAVSAASATFAWFTYQGTLLQLQQNREIALLQARMDTCIALNQKAETLWLEAWSGSAELVGSSERAQAVERVSQGAASLRGEARLSLLGPDELALAEARLLNPSARLAWQFRQSNRPNSDVGSARIEALYTEVQEAQDSLRDACGVVLRTYREITED